MKKLVRNIKNPKVTKEIDNEFLLAMYLGTKEWELIEEKKFEPSKVSNINLDKEK